MQKTIVFDFDGVVHMYGNGWQDGSIYDDPNEEVVETINELLKTKDRNVVIMSTRDPQQIVDWVNERDLFPVEAMSFELQFWNKSNTVGVTNRKVPAMVYIDDRGLHFNPFYHSTSDKLLNEINYMLK